MNHCELPRLRARTPRAFLSLSLLLLPAVALNDALAIPRVGLNSPAAAEAGPTNPLPYLRSVGSPALRFQEPPPSRESLMAFQTTAAPESATAKSSESSAATASATAGRLAAQSARDSDEAPVSDLPSELVKPTPLMGKAPESILPDDARPQIRPEEFLPYFRAPGSSKQTGDVILFVPPVPRGVPAPAPLPPSSATYTQTPK